MKKVFLLTTLVLLFAFVPAFAGNVTLSWEPSPSENVIGYMIYYGMDSGDLDYSKDAGDVLTTTIENLASGTWYFAATAYSADDESVYSNTVNTTIEGFVPTTIEHAAVEVPATITIKITVGSDE